MRPQDLLSDYQALWDSGNSSLYKALEKYAREDQPQSYLEIGVRDGASLTTVLLSTDSVRFLTLCDSYGGMYGGSGRGSHAHIDNLLSKIGYRHFVQYLDGDSREVLQFAHYDYDMALVDADHSVEGALADLKDVWPRLKNGGIIVLDDLDHPSHSYLNKMFHDFAALHPAAKIWELHEGHGVGVIRKP
jgi:predicted O-methyltransferase YrrM